MSRLPSPVKSPTTSCQRRLPDRNLFGLPERPVAVPHDNGHLVRIRIDGRQIEFPVMVEVAHQDLLQSRAHGDRERAAEAALTVAKEDRHVGGAGIGDGQVDLAVAVEIAGRDAVRVRCPCSAGRVSERAVTVVDEDGDVSLEAQAVTPGRDGRRWLKSAAARPVGRCTHRVRSTGGAKRPVPSPKRIDTCCPDCCPPQPRRDCRRR